MRITESNNMFYSTDNYAWTGSKINYDDSDKFSGLHDYNNRPIFINDMVLLIKSPDNKFSDGQYVIKNVMKNMIEFASINSNKK